MLRKELTLVDMMTRHQIFLEGVKAGQSKLFNDTAAEFRKSFLELILELDIAFASMGQLTKKKLVEFIVKLRAKQFAIYNTFSAQLLKDLEGFVDADRDLTKNMLELYTGEKVEKKDKAFFGVLLTASAIKANAKLLSVIKNSPIPANGMLPLNFIGGFIASASAVPENLIRKAYANNWTVKQMNDALFGTAAKNFRDGEITRVGYQANSLINTLWQHSSAIISAAIGSQFFDRYVWVSILDDKTTNTCRERDGRVYEYGKGPLAPAHYFCRSKNIPIDPEATVIDEPTTYYSWLKNQPKEVQDEILGTSRATSLASGQLKSVDLGKFSVVQSLTAEQFRDKLSVITKT